MIWGLTISSIDWCHHDYHHHITTTSPPLSSLVVCLVIQVQGSKLSRSASIGDHRFLRHFHVEGVMPPPIEALDVVVFQKRSSRALDQGNTIGIMIICLVLLPRYNCDCTHGHYILVSSSLSLWNSIKFTKIQLICLNCVALRRILNVCYCHLKLHISWGNSQQRRM